MSKSLTGKQIFKMWVDRFVSIGAAVVIIGALFKILHWKFANELLIVGMFTEAGIFLIYALLPEPPVGIVDPEGRTKIDSTELINALHEVKLSIENTNSSLHVISSSTNGLKELEAKFDAMGKTIDELNHFYGSLKNVSETISSSVGEAARTKDQLSALANNLTELNAIYSNMIHAIKGK
jgi:hypothetical protein